MVTIVGGGPAGVAAAVWARRLGFDAVVYEAEERLGGALWRWTEPVTDLPGWVGSPADLAASYQAQLSALGVRVRSGRRVSALERGRLRVAGRWRPYGHLVVAVGVRPRQPDVELPPAPAPPLPGRFYAVLGGGDGAASAALRLQAAGARVVVLHRGRLRIQPRWRPALDCRRATVVGCQTVGDRWRLELSGGGGLIVDGAVARLGFVPDAGWTGLPLASGGLIRADRWGRTGWPGVYVVGDVSSRTPPSRASLCNAYAQGMYAVKHLALHPGLDA